MEPQLEVKIVVSSLSWQPMRKYYHLQLHPTVGDNNNNVATTFTPEWDEKLHYQKQILHHRGRLTNITAILDYSCSANARANDNNADTILYQAIIFNAEHSNQKRLIFRGLRFSPLACLSNLQCYTPCNV
jgi:hypothetical protein